MKPVAIAPYTITAASTGTRMKGTNITGFMTIGNPNTTGSFTLNIAGKAATFPNAWYCLDFDAKSIATTSPNVIPEPDRIKNESKNC